MGKKKGRQKRINYLEGIPKVMLKKLIVASAKQSRGPTKRRWTEEELDLIRRFYPNVPAEKIARKLDRPLQSIYRMAQRLDVKKTKASKVHQTKKAIYKRWYPDNPEKWPD